MPPTTEEFKKLMALGRLLRRIGNGGEEAGPAAEELLALLPGLRTVFGPAFSPTVHEHLDAIEADIRADRVEASQVEARADAISDALGIAFTEQPEPPFAGDPPRAEDLG